MNIAFVYFFTVHLLALPIVSDVPKVSSSEVDRPFKTLEFTAGRWSANRMYMVNHEPGCTGYQRTMEYTATIDIDVDNKRFAEFIVLDHTVGVTSKAVVIEFDKFHGSWVFRDFWLKPTKAIFLGDPVMAPGGIAFLFSEQKSDGVKKRLSFFRITESRFELRKEKQITEHRWLAYWKIMYNVIEEDLPSN